MIWLSIVGLAAGALLAQRFKIIVLAPATLAVVVVAIAAGVAQTNGVWLTILTMAAASIGIQIGYFVGMLIPGLGVLLARRSSSFSDTRPAQPPQSFGPAFLVDDFPPEESYRRWSPGKGLAPLARLTPLDDRGQRPPADDRV